MIDRIGHFLAVSLNARDMADTASRIDMQASPAPEAFLVGPAIFVGSAILVTVVLGIVMRRVFRLIEHNIDQMTANHNGEVSLLLSPVPDALVLAYGIQEGFVKLPKGLKAWVRPWPTVLDLLKRGNHHIAYTNKRSAAAMIASDPEGMQISDQALCHYAGSAIMISESHMDVANFGDLPTADVATLFDLLKPGKIAAYEGSDQIGLLRRIFERFQISCPDRILPIPLSEDLVAAAYDHKDVIGYFGSVTERVIGQKSGFVAAVDHVAIKDFDLSKEVNSLVYRTEKGNPTYNAAVRQCVKSLEELWWATVVQIRAHEYHRNEFLKLLNTEVSESYKESEKKFCIENIFTSESLEDILENWFVFDNPGNDTTSHLKLVPTIDPKAA